MSRRVGAHTLSKVGDRMIIHDQRERGCIELVYEEGPDGAPCIKIYFGEEKAGEIVPFPAGSTEDR